jgi:hypothetical protein
MTAVGSIELCQAGGLSFFQPATGCFGTEFEQAAGRTARTQTRRHQRLQRLHMPLSKEQLLNTIDGLLTQMHEAYGQQHMFRSFLATAVHFMMR